MEHVAVITSGFQSSSPDRVLDEGDEARRRAASTTHDREHAPEQARRSNRLAAAARRGPRTGRRRSATFSSRLREVVGVGGLDRVKRQTTGEDGRKPASRRAGNRPGKLRPLIRVAPAASRRPTSFQHRGQDARRRSPRRAAAAGWRCRRRDRSGSGTAAPRREQREQRRPAGADAVASRPIAIAAGGDCGGEQRRCCREASATRGPSQLSEASSTTASASVSARPAHSAGDRAAAAPRLRRALHRSPRRPAARRPSALAAALAGVPVDDRLSLRRRQEPRLPLQRKLAVELVEPHPHRVLARRRGLAAGERPSQTKLYSPSSASGTSVGKLSHRAAFAVDRPRPSPAAPPA